MPFIHCIVDSKNIAGQEHMIYPCCNQAGLILPAYIYPNASLVSLQLHSVSFSHAELKSARLWYL